MDKTSRCPECGQDVRVNTQGNLRGHVADPDADFTEDTPPCPGSYKPAK